MKAFLWLTLIVGMVFYLFWDKMPEGYFFYGNALFITMLCGSIYMTDRKSFIKFYIFSLSLSNLIDELRVDNMDLHINELILLIFLPLIWHYKKIKQWLKKLWNNITCFLRR